MRAESFRTLQQAFFVVEAIAVPDAASDVVQGKSDAVGIVPQDGEGVTAPWFHTLGERKPGLRIPYDFALCVQQSGNRSIVLSDARANGAGSS